FHQQVAAGGKREPLGATELHADPPRVSLWPEHEIVFELRPVSVINHIDAGINRRVTDAGKLRNSGTPLAAGTDDIVGIAGESVGTLNHRRRIRPDQGHAERPAFMRKDDFPGGEEKLIGSSPGGITHGTVPLPGIGLETERQAAELGGAGGDRGTGPCWQATDHGDGYCETQTHRECLGKMLNTMSK